MKFSFGKKKPLPDDAAKVEQPAAEAVKGGFAKIKEKRARRKDSEGDVGNKEIAVKGKRPSFARQPRFTLLIGDEGAILIYMKGSKVLSRQFVPDASESNLNELRETVAKDSKAPITVILDSMDQAFVQQTLPPVSSLSVQKLIKRRMDRDFRPDDIKGAIILGKDKEGRKDWNFLMISVDKSPQMTLWLEFIMSFENRFRGIVLLSVETEVFVKKLERAMGGIKLATPSEWKFIVSHNKVGGFRQIILRNGRLIFTRLAQPVGEPTPEVIAGNIEQEMATTIEYLKRFGYDNRKGLDIFIIISEATAKLIDVRRFEARTTHIMTPYEISQYMGISGATQPTDQYGDVIMASTIGGSRASILKLTTVESRLFDSTQRLKYGQRLLGTFLLLGLLVYGAYLGYNALIVNSDIEDLQQKKTISDRTLAQVKKKVSDSKLDIDAMTDRINLYRVVKEQQRTPLPTLTLIASAIKSPLVIKSFQIKAGDQVKWQDGMTPQPLEASQPDNPVQTIAEAVTITVRIDYPVGLKNAVMFKKFNDDTLKEIQAVLKGYTVMMSDPPREYMESNSLQISFDKDTQASATIGLNPVPMEIYIYGPLVTSIKGVEEP